MATNEARDALRAERAGRIRMARAFAGKEQADLAHLLGVSIGTVKRMERGHRDISEEELHAIGDFCEVPRGFMEVGFAPFIGTPGEHDDELEDVVPATAGEVRRLRADVTRLAEALAEPENALALVRQALEDMRAGSVVQNG